MSPNGCLLRGAAHSCATASTVIGSADDHEGVAVLHGLAVFYKDSFDDAGPVRFDFIEQLHCFNDADGVAFHHRLADFDEHFAVGRRCAVESADHWGLKDMG